MTTDKEKVLKELRRFDNIVFGVDASKKSGRRCLP